MIDNGAKETQDEMNCLTRKDVAYTSHDRRDSQCQDLSCLPFRGSRLRIGRGGKAATQTHTTYKSTSVRSTTSQELYKSIL